MTLPFQMPDPFSFPRRVFAHYFYPLPLSIDNKLALSDYYNLQYLAPGGENGKWTRVGGYLRARPLPAAPTAPNYQVFNMTTEVQMAVARGITGFTFDILDFNDAMAPTGHLSNMLIAASSVNDFAVVPMLDMSSMASLTQPQAVQLIASFTHPSFLREPDGRVVVAAFNATKQTLAWWQAVIAALNAKSFHIAFLPVLLGSPTSSILDPIAIGTAGWGTATATAALAKAGYMAPILTQQFRPKSAIFWESSNFDTFRNAWASALAGSGPYAQIVTWNDFSETGQVQPYTDATLVSNIGTGFYDLTAYYATWFMSGIQPVITKDVLYWCYRRMTSSATHPNQSANFTVVAPALETAYIELLAFLTAPGTLMINGQASPAMAGITSLKVPATPGNPVMALQRNGSDVQRGTCPVTIYGPQGSPAGTLDLTYWSGNI